MSERYSKINGLNKTLEHMLSILICSRTPILSEAMISNLRETAGIPYELIVVDESIHNGSIFRAYNYGIDHAKYDLLCFMHDDILFHTPQWAKILADHLAKPTIGFIGVAGGTLVPRVPAQWSFGKHFGRILQYDKKKGRSILLDSTDFKDEHSQAAVAMDGVFLACRKDVAEQLRFDEQTFKGFHCYDIDICLQAHKLGYENRVVNNILLEHFSRGKLNRHWVENQLVLWRKWRAEMPMSVTAITNEELLDQEISYLESSFTRKMIRRGFTNRDILAVFSEYNALIMKGTPLRASMNNLRLTWIRLLKRPLSLFK